jgi:RNA polymerase sigma factor (sigma-70 family)
MMTDDMALVREYAERNSEAAFATLVSRHVNLVYSVALQQVHDAHLAEEITQAVFIILAQKAKSLSSKTILSGWLCRTARYASANALKIQQRRQHREQEAYMQSTLNEPESDEAWTQIAPLLSTALAQLGEKDHDAIVLRFFDGKNMNEVGAALGVSENTAKTRVSRAVEKLRTIFLRRGLSLSTGAIAGAISANSVQAAPTALVTSISAVAITKGTVTTGSTLTIVKGALKLMGGSKAKTTVIVGVGILLLGGGITTVVLQAKARAHRERDRAMDPVAYAFRNQSQVDANRLREQLVGNWALEAKRLGVDKEYTHYKDNNRQKMWTLTNWAIVRYGERSNIIYSASGPYELRGDLYIETIENATGLMTNYIGTRPQYRLRVDGDKYYQTALGDKPFLQEIGHRLPQ